MVNNNITPASEILMSEQKIARVDGSLQNIVIEEKLFVPDGLMEHQYIPLQTVQIQQMGTGVFYSTDYFSVERFWRVWLPQFVYDLLMSKFLQGKTVSLDYSTVKTIGKIGHVFIPKDKRVDGFSILYKEHMEALKILNGDELDMFMASLGYDDIEGVHYASLLT